MLVIYAVLAITSTGAIGQCVAGCEKLKARLAKVDCSIAFGVMVAYVSENKAIVGNFPDELRRNRTSVVTFRAGMAEVSRTAQDCLVNEKSPRRAVTDAFLSVRELHDYVANWIDGKPKVPEYLEKQFLERLVKTHAKALEALSSAKKSF